MNIKKIIILSLLKFSGSGVPKKLKIIKGYWEYSDKEKINLQTDKLKNLLLDAYQSVPYYKKIFTEYGVVSRGGDVDLTKYSGLPFLTKDIIIEQGEKMYSFKHAERKSYENSSGGTTGEPIRFIQDKEYDEWNNATKLFFNKQVGKDIGEREIKLWGSDRDIIEGTLGWKENLKSKLFSRKFFNCYNFADKDMKRLFDLNNSFEPVYYWAYVEAAYEFAKYINKNNLKLKSPKTVATSIGPLHDFQREVIKKAFDCPVYNQYGSREVGIIACQDKEIGDLNVYFWRHLVEIIPKSDNQTGEIVVTCLDNYSMPLIRYKIGDVAILGGESNIIDGIISSFSIKNVVGRTLGFFKRPNGDLIHTHYLVQQMFFHEWLKRFQIIQEKSNKIFCLLEIRDDFDEPSQGQIKAIEKKMKIFLGDEFEINFEIVDKILPSKSGKYVYTICKI